jgi:hypothetical protein
MGCDYEWHDRAGATLDRRDDLLWLNDAIASPDGSRLLLLQREALDPCGEGETRPMVAEGTALLLDVGSGAEMFTLHVRSNLWNLPAFSTSGSFFHLSPIADGACSIALPVYRGMTPPYAPFDAGGLYLEQELAGGRWLAWRGPLVLVREPSGRELALADDPAAVQVGGGWVHAHQGYGELSEEIVAAAPDGSTHAAQLDANRPWRARDGWGRWSVVCEIPFEPRPSTGCLVVDVTGARAALPLDLVVGPAVTTAFVGEGSALVFKTADAAGPRWERVDLAGGAREVLVAGDAALHLLGDATAALLHDRAAGSLLLVEGDRTELIAKSQVADVLTLPGPVRGGRVSRQRLTAVIVESRGVEDHTLSVLDLGTRRLAALSDRLYFAPHVGQPFAWDDCGHPRMTRTAGAPLEGLVQDAPWVFFIEQPRAEAGYSLWVVPLDLSSPPRRLLEGFHPTYCHAPLSSRNGEVLVVDIDGYDGTTAVTVGTP